MTELDFALTCPSPLDRRDTVRLAHGGGGRLSRELVEKLFLPAFDGRGVRERHDSAVLSLGAERLAFTTDSYVVEPRFFPGGDIGKLAVFGTVNDLAMAGARPLYLSAGFILEEGLPIEELRRVVASMRSAAEACGVELVTGDTKVVDRGKADGIFVNTSGIGVLGATTRVGPGRIEPGDAVLLSGDVGRHGIAVLSVRAGLSFETAIESDCAPLASHVAALFAAGVDVHCLRDATRGGLATALCELALDARVSIEVDERTIAVSDEVRGACELLGLDPLYVACEGRMLAFVPAAQAGAALRALRECSGGDGAAMIGRVGATPPGIVKLVTSMGSGRFLDLMSGEQLPRIC